MEQIPLLVVLLIVAVTSLLLGSLFMDHIYTHIRAKGLQFPNDGFLLYGSMGLLLFTLGLLVMYLLLRM